MEKDNIYANKEEEDKENRMQKSMRDKILIMDECRHKNDCGNKMYKTIHRLIRSKIRIAIQSGQMQNQFDHPNIHKKLKEIVKLYKRWKPSEKNEVFEKNMIFFCNNKPSRETEINADLTDPAIVKEENEISYS